MYLQVNKAWGATPLPAAHTIDPYKINKLRKGQKRYTLVVSAGDHVIKTGLVLLFLRIWAGTPAYVLAHISSKGRTSELERGLHYPVLGLRVESDLYTAKREVEKSHRVKQPRKTRND